MASLVVLFVLGFVAGTYSAPDDSASIVIFSEDNNTKELDDAVEGIIKKIATNDTAGAEKSFRDFIDKAVKAESRVSDSTIVDDSDENSETKEIKNVLKHVIIKIAKDGKGAEKKIREILEAAANTGQLDRSFVSDLINSTLGGVHMGLSIGSNNGTSNQLCIKLGNIVMSGCRRAVAKETINDNNRTMLNPEKKARMARRNFFLRFNNYFTSRRLKRIGSVFDVLLMLANEFICLFKDCETT